MAIPAAQYLRMSTEQQQYSLENQAEAIRDYATRLGFEIVQTYSDAGRSGVRLKDRPGIIRLLSDVMTGHVIFRAILVYDVSRWGRFQDCDEAAHYEFICKSAGIPVHYRGEIFTNDNTLSSSIFKALKRTMAAEYSRELGTKTFAGAQRLAELGFKQGGKPGYGLRRLMISADGQQKRLLARREVKSLRTDRVVLVPGSTEEVERVREMYRLVVSENRTPYDITDEFNRKSLSCTDGKWRVGRVCKILTDPKYAGYNVWNRSSGRLGQRRVGIPKSKWVLKQNAFEPVVDQQLFENAQRVLAAQRRPYSNDELLRSLQKLLAEHGTLSYRIMQNSPHLASMTTFINRFGSLRRAFELAGYKYPWTDICHEYGRQRERMREELLHQLSSLFQREVSILRPDPEGPEYLQVDESVTVAIVVCPAIRRGGDLTWLADSRRTDRKTVTLLARMTEDNEQFRDFYVLPVPGRHWIRHSGELKRGKRLVDLSEFCSAVRAISFNHQHRSRSG